MNESVRRDARAIVDAAIGAVLPDAAVCSALEGRRFPGRTVLVAVGKAAWRMAREAVDVLGGVDAGIAITKYGHVMGEIPGVVCREAGHPVPDANGFAATEEALGLVSGLSPDDTVILLLSGGGSALLEKPLVPADELADITGQLLACGAGIAEVNAVRKRLSAVKGGRLAQLCAPARVLAVVLSDVLGDPLDVIASGPAYPDASTCADALRVVGRYGLRLSQEALACLERETPKALDNVETLVTGSVRELCRAASEAAERLGYEAVLLTDRLDCEAREAGRFMASILRSHAGDGRRLAFVAGGETVVRVVGSGRGGRNQELALAACEGIAGLSNAVLISVGSDGTDGPTDAAGGCVDGDSLHELAGCGIDARAALGNNDSHTALAAIGGLVVTGPTGTNVNDVAVGLLG